jgi:hypothetical protein
MDEREAALILCYLVRALQNWLHRGGGPTNYCRIVLQDVIVQQNEGNGPEEEGGTSAPYHTGSSAPVWAE